MCVENFLFLLFPFSDRMKGKAKRSLLRDQLHFSWNSHNAGIALIRIMRAHPLHQDHPVRYARPCLACIRAPIDIGMLRSCARAELKSVKRALIPCTVRCPEHPCGSASCNRHFSQIRALPCIIQCQFLCQLPVLQVLRMQNRIFMSVQEHDHVITAGCFMTIYLGISVFIHNKRNRISRQALQCLSPVRTVCDFL